jgi:hypothetical protein
MDWAAFYYLEGGLLFGFLAAAGLTLISLVRPDYRIARRCAWAAAILFGSIAVVWGFTTMESAWIRIPAVGLAGLVAAICLTEALRFIAKHEAASHPVNAAPAQPAPAATQAPPAQRRSTLEATRNSTIDATGALIPGDLPFQFGRADDHSVISMPGTVVTRNSDGTITVEPAANPVNYQFPPPTGEFRGLTNVELKEREMKTAADLQEFEGRMMAEFRTLPRQPQGGVPEDIFKTYAEKYRAEYQDKFAGQCRSLASEMLARIESAAPGTKIPGSPGAFALYHNTFAGARPASEVAEFLDVLRERIRD